MKKAKIAVVGGGIAGSTVASYLSDLGLHVHLFEKTQSLVSGPPFCHLHAGGNLYPDISINQCITLLKESIDLVRFYPLAVDYRPTVIAIPQSDTNEPSTLVKRLEVLEEEYETLIKQDGRNEVLGKSENYYKLYSKEEALALQTQMVCETPKTLDEWMIPVVKSIDLNTMKFPLVIVQEYGLNLFRVASTVSARLKKNDNCTVHLNTTVTQLHFNQDTWNVEYTHENQTHNDSFDYIINAAGFRTGTLDDMLGFKRNRLVEFKAAYVSKWENDTTAWPEVVFYGKRGTSKGMAQFTPYPGGYFQLHGMTHEITLFDKGLAKSDAQSAYPSLEPVFLEKIEKKWNPEIAKNRTNLAIEHLAQFMPAFKKAVQASKPLYGAQQIPGEDASLRAADVSFEQERYARCEVVKASSVLSMTDAITQQLINLGYLDQRVYRSRPIALNEKDRTITKDAQKLCQDREYPTCLAHRLISK